MKILIVGCGGRENILTQKLKSQNNRLYCIGPWINPDIYNMVNGYKVSELDKNLVLQYCHEIRPFMVVIGPETILQTTFVDECSVFGYRCIGPHKVLAQLETSKVFTRRFLKQNFLQMYNPEFKYFEKNTDVNSIPYEKFVIKLDGLASGKGVFVQDDHFKSSQEGLILLNEKLSNHNVLVEEKLVGQEFSLFTLSDGIHFFHLPPVQDFKRVFENDKGPNTGGMGSILNNFDFLEKNDLDNSKKLNENILIIMRKKFKIPYIGVLYGSFMKTNYGQIKLIEYNCRFGDSEVFNLLNSIQTDLSLVFYHMLHSSLNEILIQIKPIVSIVKYLVPKGYPNESIQHCIHYKPLPNVYAASINEQNYLLGSRSIAVYGEGQTLHDAYFNCENLIKKINNQNQLYYRKDIGFVDPDDEFDSYKSAGVDVDKGNQFVKMIQNDVESTYNQNVIGKHGNFGGQFKFNDDTLVASTDGVGTKSILIKKYNENYYTCGHDLVNHSVNDILVQGATPLFFLDYVASANIDISDVHSFVKGCCDACKIVDCVLIGGETAEMPSVYQQHHMDMVGTIVGKKLIHIDPNGVLVDDIAIGFSSSGPQTNGYTLIRKIMDSHEPPQHILNSLLNPHSSFLQHILIINNLFTISGMCHITGGGLTENLKRTIPNHLTIPLEEIVYPQWCQWLKEAGNLNDTTLRKTFNCGIGFFVFIRPKANFYQLLNQTNLLMNSHGNNISPGKIIYLNKVINL